MQYKHKHTGQIVTKGKDGLYHSQEGGYTLQRWIFENSNDWEEVKEEKLFGVSTMKEEPNYLITSFREINVEGNVFSLQKDGRYNNSVNNGGMKLKPMLNGFASVEDETLEIYSVKNSKGEEFKVEEVVGIFRVKFKINKFEIIHNVIMVYFTDGNNCILEDIEKIKDKFPIYTTTDGVEIFEGDRVWLSLLHKDLSLHKNDLVLIGNFSKQDKEVADRYLTFTSEENRDKYIKDNTKKPIFVSADGKEYFEGNDTGYNLFSVNPKNNFLERRFIVTQAIENKEYIHFHTKEARQEYIDTNKPKYSLADVFMASEKIPSGHLITTGMLDQLKKLGK